MWDTHPCYSDRVNAVRRQGQSGFFTLHIPARKLLREHSMLCRAVTQRFYTDGLGEDLSNLSLVDTVQVVKEQQAAVEEFRQAGRYFQDLLSIHCPLLLNYAPRPAGGDLQPTIDSLMDCRSRMQQQYPAAKEAFDEYAKACAELTDGRCNLALLEGGFSHLTDAAGRKTDRAQCLAEQARTQTRQAEHWSVVATYQTLAKQRLMAALALLETDQTDWGLPDIAARRVTVRRCLEMLRSFASIFPTLGHLHDAAYAASMLLENLQKNQQNEAIIETIKRKLNVVRDDLMQLRGELRDAEYPFPRSGGPATIAEYAMPKIAGEHEMELLAQAQTARENLFHLYIRCLAAVTAMAEAVENALGLPPLPEREDMASSPEK